MIDPSWIGRVTFYELIFGTCPSYFFLILMWEQLLKTQLEEWKYIMITFLGASFFLINHYFQNAPFYLWLLYGYTVVFLIVYFFIGVNQISGSLLKKTLATLSAIVFTIAFIFFEHIAQWGVKDYGINEFWFMLIAYFGYIAVILWRALLLKNQSPDN